MGRKNRFVSGIVSIILVLSMLCTGLGLDSPDLVFAAEGEESSADVVISFDTDSVKPGDTIGVLNAPEGSSFLWQKKTLESASDVRSDAANTATITDEVLTYETVDVADVEGSSLTLTDDWNESFVICQVTTPERETTELSLYCSRLPVMYINSDTAYYEVTKADYSDATMKLVGNEAYGDSKVSYDGAMQIKTRGNSTCTRAKRPFKLKLDKKTNLLNLDTAKSKHWVLLANDIDHSLVRNKLLYDFSGDIGTEYYFTSTNISVIYNGNYEGVYQLCEHRRVDEGRIDIFDWTGAGEDAAAAIAEAEFEAAGYTKASKMEDALNEVMYQDYSWMDSASVALKGTTYNFSDYGITLPEANGGFLAEMDFYSIGSSSNAALTTAYGQPLYVSAPEPGADAEDLLAAVTSFKGTKLYEYANTYTQTFEYALHSPDFTFRSGTNQKIISQDGWDNRNNEYHFYNGWSSRTRAVNYTDAAHEGYHYSELFDMDSLVTNFIFVEYAMNWDSMKNSFFFYKDINAEDGTEQLAKFGPQWDFDWCWGNTNMYNIETVNEPIEWHTTIESFTSEQPYQSYQFNRLLIKDPYFLVRVYEKYHNVRDVMEDMIKEGGLIDQYEDYLAEAGQANDIRWSYTYSTDYSGAVANGFEASVSQLRDFVTTRVEWLDRQFASIETLMGSLGYYGEADDIDVFVTVKDGNASVSAVTSNTDCRSITFQLNGTMKKTVKVSEGVAEITFAKSDLIADGSALNVVTAYEQDQNGNYINNTQLKPSGNYEYIPKSAYAAFSVATDGKGESVADGVSFYDQTIKGTVAWNGSEDSRDYILEGDGSITLNVTAVEPADYGAFSLCAEVHDESARYLTTCSWNSAWYLGSDSFVTFDGEGTPELVKGNDYRITYTRSGSVLTIEYYDLTNGKLQSVFTGDFAFNDKTLFHIIAQEGTFRVWNEQLSAQKIVVPWKTPAGGSTGTSGTGQHTTNQAADTTVKVAAVKVKSVVNKAKSVTIKWSKVSGADGYYIYRAAGKGKAKLIAKVSGAAKTNYIDKKSLKNGSTYTYTVKAYKGKVAGTCKTAGSIVRLTVPKFTGVSSKKAGTLAVKYGKNAKATGYEIQYSTSKKFTKSVKKKVASAKKTSKTISGLKKGKTYYVRVRAYKKSGGKILASAWSSAKKVKIQK